jgi:hypothetical protein
MPVVGLSWIKHKPISRANLGWIRDRCLGAHILVSFLLNPQTRKNSSGHSGSQVQNGKYLEQAQPGKFLQHHKSNLLQTLWLSTDTKIVTQSTTRSESETFSPMTFSPRSWVYLQKKKSGNETRKKCRYMQAGKGKGKNVDKKKKSVHTPCEGTLVIHLAIYFCECTRKRKKHPRATYRKSQIPLLQKWKVT